MLAIWGGGGSLLHTSVIVGKSHVGVLSNCSISNEYSCFTSDNLCCNTSLSDSAQNYALLFMLSCSSDYPGRCHCAFKIKKRLSAAVCASRNVKINRFSLPCMYFSLEITMYSKLGQLPTGNTEMCQVSPALLRAKVVLTKVLE